MSDYLIFGTFTMLTEDELFKTDPIEHWQILKEIFETDFEDLRMGKKQEAKDQETEI